jgi:hypothetical protein
MEVKAPETKMSSLVGGDLAALREILKKRKEMGVGKGFDLSKIDSEVTRDYPWVDKMTRELAPGDKQGPTWLVTCAICNKTSRRHRGDLFLWVVGKAKGLSGPCVCPECQKELEALRNNPGLLK